MKLSKLKHCTEVALLNSDFFKQKMMTSIHSQKEIPGWQNAETGVDCPLCTGMEILAWFLVVGKYYSHA